MIAYFDERTTQENLSATVKTIEGLVEQKLGNYAVGTEACSNRVTSLNQACDAI